MIYNKLILNTSNWNKNDFILMGFLASIPLFIILLFMPDEDYWYNMNEWNSCTNQMNFVEHKIKVNIRTHHCIDTVKCGDDLPKNVKTIHPFSL